MSTTLELRRGLPRVPGGEPWPPAGFVEVEDRADFLAETAGQVPVERSVPAPSPRPAPEPSPTPAAPPVAAPAPTTATSETLTQSLPLRRGLPRVPGGESWPPAGIGLLTAGAALDDLPVVPASTPAEESASSPPASAPVSAPASAPTTRTARVALRRGLPRASGGEPWPSAGFGLLTVGDEPEPAVVAPAPESAPVLEPVRPAPPPPTAARPTPPVRPAAAGPPAPATAARTPALVRLVDLVRRFPVPAVVVAVALVGGLMTLASVFAGSSAGTAFLTRYPGSYPLPAGADPGFPAWVRWNHVLNFFFIVLIVRTGLGVHYEKKPPAYWTPKTPALGGKISITAWIHQSLDVLWLANGAVFLVLLFVTDHWMRIVPTSWAVFPNALSAALQYLTFDWPPEAGWTSYNSLQQLAYFTVVFVAAPLAALTGFRMSGLWPTSAKRLSRLYPIELARAVHFPTMVFFVAFVVGHVALVFLTGARANLNHMYAGTEAVSWTGFWIFVAALAVVAVAWELLRPTLLAPVANLFGRVSQR